MFVQKNQAEDREFLGVKFKLLAHGDNSMATKMLYQSGTIVPEHKHPNEQTGYVISGKYIIINNGERKNIGEGDSYHIPKDVVHSIEVIESGEVLDFFSPPRIDYL